MFPDVEQLMRSLGGDYSLQEDQKEDEEEKSENEGTLPEQVRHFLDHFYSGNQNTGLVR